MPTPTTVKVAFWILLLGLILDAIAAIVTLVAAIAMMNSGQSIDVGGTQANGGVLLATAIGLIVLVVIELFILWKMKAGRNWARIVITILEILSLGSAFAGVSTIGIIAIILSIVAVVLMWLPASNEYFRSSRNALA
ncbi:hypothetical protein GCM10025768_18580 [Microbacterium pseudoresistens]|uniref:Putative membrane protein n=1 Tax=Microbacterium pseudoresistens TaxID=640634 RepID=A0A7Y9JN59_9MICO|nr:hypothetical protein [Microbacterium pseudoresistens]NYD55552.1 putative membrane protein [Microbacterium pseudoresistens]